jgi:hypothetical protein
MTEETKSQTAPEAEAPTAQDNTELTISDLAAMKTIIDIASSRGSFKPNEMMAVGQTYNKLTAFLDTVAKQPKQGA